MVVHRLWVNRINANAESKCDKKRSVNKWVCRTTHTHTHDKFHGTVFKYHKSIDQVACNWVKYGQVLKFVKKWPKKNQFHRDSINCCILFRSSQENCFYFCFVHLCYETVILLSFHTFMSSLNEECAYDSDVDPSKSARCARAPFHQKPFESFKCVRVLLFHLTVTIIRSNTFEMQNAQQLPYTVRSTDNSNFKNIILYAFDCIKVLVYVCHFCFCLFVFRS